MRECGHRADDERECGESDQSPAEAAHDGRLYVESKRVGGGREAEGGRWREGGGGREAEGGRKEFEPTANPFQRNGGTEQSRLFR
jgi:hypothetical protein